MSLRDGGCFCLRQWRIRNRLDNRTTGTQCLIWTQSWLPDYNYDL